LRPDQHRELGPANRIGIGRRLLARPLRILRERLCEMLRRTGSGDGRSLAQLIHFTPHALEALEGM
jgi:hypothetical protein